MTRSRLPSGKPLARSGQLRRRTPLRPVSGKRQAEAYKRNQVRQATFQRAGWRCQAAHLVPEVACWGPLDCDEIAPRGVYPGGHLDPGNTQALCRAHHDWKHAHPIEATKRGLRRSAPPTRRTP